MACFAVPVAEAIIVTAAKKIIEKKEVSVKVADCQSVSADNEKSGKITFSKKLGWLKNLLWGGSILLAFEHLWHGEIVPWFPFLTAAGNPEDMAEVLYEMSTVGVAMAVMITAVWAVMLLASSVIEKRAVKEEKSEITQ